MNKNTGSETMNEEWKSIYEDYQLAKAALRGPKRGCDGWFRDEEKGRYYMWRAYHRAMSSNTKEQLLYARILSMMASETQWGTNDYDRYHKYIKPAKEAYQLAMNSDNRPTEKEWERIKFEAESLAYQFDCKDRSEEDQMLNIIGHEKLNGFQFHDSEPLHFEHSKDTARLVLRIYGITVTILFEKVFEIRLEGDPLDNWIFDCYCYPSFHDKNKYIFDAGFYWIMCERISIEDVVRNKDDK